VISKVKKEKGFVTEERKTATDHKSSATERKPPEKTSPVPQTRGRDKVIGRFANVVSEISDLQRLYSELEKQYEQEKKLRQDADRTILDLRQQLESMNQQLYQSPYPFNQRPVTQFTSDPSHVQYSTSSLSLCPGPPFAAPLPNMSTIIYPGESVNRDFSNAHQWNSTPVPFQHGQPPHQSQHPINQPFIHGFLPTASQIPTPVQRPMVADTRISTNIRTTKDQLSEGMETTNQPPTMDNDVHNVVQQSERVAGLTQQDISSSTDDTLTIHQHRESEEPDAQPPSNESTLRHSRDHENNLRNITHPDNATDKPIESASPVETERTSILQNMDSENPVDAISSFNLTSNDSPIQSNIPRVTNPQNPGVGPINPPQPSINTVADPTTTTIDGAASQPNDLGKNVLNFGNESVTDTVNETVSKSKTNIAQRSMGKARKMAIADARRANLEKARAKQSKPETSSTITSKSGDMISESKEVSLPFASFNSINRDSDSLGSSDELKEEELKEMIGNWQRENADYAIIFEDDCSTIFESY
jgi:hypothetical protein